jgi:hypothetical protein
MVDVSSVECLEPIIEGSPCLTNFESYLPGPGTEFFIFASLQFGTLDKKIDAFPVELKAL